MLVSQEVRLRVIYFFYFLFRCFSDCRIQPWCKAAKHDTSNLFKLEDHISQSIYTYIIFTYYNILIETKKVIPLKIKIKFRKESLLVPLLQREYEQLQKLIFLMTQGTAIIARTYHENDLSQIWNRGRDHNHKLVEGRSQIGLIFLLQFEKIINYQLNMMVLSI